MKRDNSRCLEAHVLEDYYTAKRRLLHIEDRPFIKRVVAAEFDNGAPLYRTMLVREIDVDTRTNEETWPHRVFEEYGSCYITFLNSEKSLYSITFESASDYHRVRSNTDVNYWFNAKKESPEANDDDMRFCFDLDMITQHPPYKPFFLIQITKDDKFVDVSHSLCHALSKVPGISVTIANLLKRTLTVTCDSNDQAFALHQEIINNEEYTIDGYTLNVVT